MLRLTEIKLPLDHPESAIKAAILERLGIAADDLVGYTHRPARLRCAQAGAILFVYTLDVEAKNEQAMLKRLKGDKHLSPDAGHQLPLRGAGAGRT